MAIDTKASFTGSIPENYDRYSGPVIFEPFADDLARRIVEAGPRRAVLETACGTGIVTRRLRCVLPATVRLVATDLNQAMLDFARTKSGSESIEWRKADALALPFEASSFDAVACGFGVMFMPDKTLAFRETRRVLDTGGFFAFNVWEKLDANPSTACAQDTMRELFGGHEPEFFKLPFGFNDRDLIRDLMAGEGFGRIRFEPVTIEVKFPSARDFATGVIRGTPASHEIQQRGISLDKVVDAVAVALARAFGDNPFRAERCALVVTAHAA